MKSKIIKRKINDSKFMYSAPNNFICIWVGVTFGVADGRVFSDATFKTLEDELNWIAAQEIHLNSMLERFKVYKEYLILLNTIKK